jgi:ankyrin repeat protein
MAPPGLLISNNMDYEEIAVRQNELFAVVIRGPKREVIRLLGNGADVNSKDRKRRTPLSRAAEYRQVRISRLLLERGAVVDTRDHMGRTPLSFAAEFDCPAIVKLLLDARADINSQCDNYRTPLIYAAEGGNPRVIKLLLQNGADRTIRDCEGSSALLVGYFSAAKYHEDVVALLKEEPFKQVTRLKLTELEAQVLNDDWTLKDGWDWIYDGEGKHLFFQSYEREITAKELCNSRLKRFSERGPWG